MGRLHRVTGDYASTGVAYFQGVHYYRLRGKSDPQFVRLQNIFWTQHIYTVYIYIYIYVTGHGKRAHFAHYFKIELLVFKGSVDLKQ